MSSFSRASRFPSRASVDTLCMQRGFLFPGYLLMKNWIIALLEDMEELGPTEFCSFKEHISTAWDDGALRTFYAYFYGHNAVAADALWMYYVYFNDICRCRWICENPSAAAVWVCRYVNSHLTWEQFAQYH